MFFYAHVERFAVDTSAVGIYCGHHVSRRESRCRRTHTHGTNYARRARYHSVDYCQASHAYIRDMSCVVCVVWLLCGRVGVVLVKVYTLTTSIHSPLVFAHIAGSTITVFDIYCTCSRRTYSRQDPHNHARTHTLSLYEEADSSHQLFVYIRGVFEAR